MGEVVNLRTVAQAARPRRGARGEAAKRDGDAAEAERLRRPRPSSSGGGSTAHRRDDPEA